MTHNVASQMSHLGKLRRRVILRKYRNNWRATAESLTDVVRLMSDRLIVVAATNDPMPPR
jgi:hypothetical protein